MDVPIGRTIEAKMSLTVADVITAYAGLGWTAFAPPGAVNDVIAYEPGRSPTALVPRYHFVTLSTLQGQALNNFIQNAFSNGATPVAATRSRGAVVFTDVNTNNRVIIRRRRTVKADAPAGGRGFVPPADEAIAPV